jgi:hypothetical protein
LLLAFLVACGGDDERAYDSFGYEPATLSAASGILPSSLAGRDVELIALAQEQTVGAQDPQLLLLVGVSLGNANGNGGFDTVATEWQPRTIFVLRGGSFMSSRDLDVDQGVAVTGFPDPIFRLNDDVVVVVEYVSGTTTALIQRRPRRL